MTDDELLEWYGSGATQGDMGQQDYELNMNKALNLQKQKSLSDTLAQNQASLATSQKNAEQGASVSNEKLMYYIGQQQLMSGVATGQGSSDVIKAQNSYAKNRAQINTDFSAQQQEMLNSYSQNQNALASEAFANETNILDKYYAREDAEDDEAWERQWAEDERNYLRAADELAKKDASDAEWGSLATENLNSMLSRYADDGEITDEEDAEIRKSLEKYAEHLSDNAYAQLLDAYDTSKVNSSNVQSVGYTPQFNGDETTVKNKNVNRLGSNSGNGDIKDSGKLDADISYNGQSFDLQEAKVAKASDTNLPTFGSRSVYYVKDGTAYLYDGNSGANYSISEARNLAALIRFLTDNGLVVK
jgi:hypothetical protein